MGGGWVQPLFPAPAVQNQPTILSYITQLRASDANYNFSGSVYFWGESEKANKKIQNALNAYAVLKPGEFPIFCLDITVFGGAEDGLLVTTRGIHIHEIFEDYRFIPYQEMTNVTLNDTTFMIQGVKLNAATVPEKGYLPIVLGLLHLMKDTFRPNTVPVAATPANKKVSARGSATPRPAPPQEAAASADNRIDLNRADAQILSRLFFVNIILAKKIISVRSTQGEFTSMEDFFARVHLTEAAAAEIRQKCHVENSASPAGRFIDF